MCKFPIQRALALVGLVAGVGSTGCTHNHYYGAPVPVCAEPAVLGGYGSVCDVPTQVGGGTVIAQVPARTTVVTTPPRSTRVVSSAPPIESHPMTSNTGRPSWRRSDPEGLATTRVDGDLGSPVNR